MHRSIALFCVLGLVGGAAAVAAVDEIPLPDGTSWSVAHPGVDGVTRPMAIANERVQPTYPMVASPLGEEATVVAAVVVDADGNAQRVEIVDASHPGLGFEDSAAHALFRWKFDPAVDASGEAVMSYAYVRLRFPEPRRGSSSTMFRGGGFSGGGLGAPEGGIFSGRDAGLPTVPAADGSDVSGTATPAAHDPNPRQTITRSGRTSQPTGEGQLYFRGHPEWGNVLYGGDANQDPE